jgi:aminopeptidase
MDCLLGDSKTVYKRDAIVIGSPSPDYDLLAIVGVGVEGLGFNKVEQLEECKENIRIASGIGARMLQDKVLTNIFILYFC